MKLILGTVQLGVDYGINKKKPINKVINKINKLYENNRIILFTSRGYTSKKDWRELTEKQIKLWNLKYHELHFGKPFADYYIDNKAIDILDWN